MKKIILFSFLIILVGASFVALISLRQMKIKPIEINGLSGLLCMAWINNNEIIVLSEDSSTGAWLTNIKINNKKPKILKSRHIALSSNSKKYSILNYDVSNDKVFLVRKENPGKIVSPMVIYTLSGTGNDTIPQVYWYPSAEEMIEGISKDGNYVVNSDYTHEKFSGISLRDISKNKNIVYLRLVDYRGGNFDHTGKYFVFIGNTERTYRINLYIYDINKNKLIKHSREIEGSFEPIFDCKGRFIYMPQIYLEGNRILKISTETGEIVKAYKYKSNMGKLTISPDSHWIVYFNQGKIFLVPVF